MAATLGFTHHRKRGVLVNFEGRQRVCDEEDVHGF
jgi:Tfp pilus assembly protein FimT